jgi:hypothetical protein
MQNDIFVKSEQIAVVQDNHVSAKPALQLHCTTAQAAAQRFQLKGRWVSVPWNM